MVEECLHQSQIITDIQTQLYYARADDVGCSSAIARGLPIKRTLLHDLRRPTTSCDGTLLRGAVIGRPGFIKRDYDLGIAMLLKSWCK